MTNTEMNTQTKITIITKSICAETKMLNNYIKYKSNDEHKLEKQNKQMSMYKERIEYLTELLVEAINEDAAYNPVPELLVDEEQPKVFSTPEFVNELKEKAEYISKSNRWHDFAIYPAVKTGIHVLGFSMYEYNSWFNTPKLSLKPCQGYKHKHDLHQYCSLDKKDLAHILKQNKVKGRSKCKTLEEMAKLCMSF